MIKALRAAAFGFLAFVSQVQATTVSPAKAVAFVANGFVIAASITDPGAGYRKAPEVNFLGGGGTGARAHSQISAEGSVTNIVMEGAGAGYTSTPQVVIQPPETLNIGSIALVPKLTITNAIGVSVDIQSSDNIEATNWVTLTNIFVTTDPYVFVDLTGSSQEKRYYRAERAAGPAGNPDPVSLVLIPSGSFLMGSPASEPGRVGNEGPQTTVTLSQPFYMAKYETTVGLYALVTKSNATQSELSDTHPVVNVSWVDATNFCTKYTERERAAGRLPAGYVYRLPTEAEWEYACRAGTTTAYTFGDSPDLLSEYAWFGDFSVTLHPTGEKLPNPWGLYDMCGNIWEWCFDSFGLYLGGTLSDPTGPTTGIDKILRGGDSAEIAVHCRSALRGQLPLDAKVAPGNYAVLGFRMVLGRPI